jgi:uncharacterized protein
MMAALEPVAWPGGDGKVFPVARTADFLWSAVMGPIHAKLASMGFAPAKDRETPAPETLLMLSGDLALLPLHAAGGDVGGAHRVFLTLRVASLLPANPGRDGMDYEQISREIESTGAVVHSLDEIAIGDRIIPRIARIR